MYFNIFLCFLLFKLLSFLRLLKALRCLSVIIFSRLPAPSVLIQPVID